MQNASISISNPAPAMTTARQKIALGVAGIGVLLLLVVWAAGGAVAPMPTFLAALALVAAGVGLFVREEYLTRPEGIRNNGDRKSVV